MDILGKNIEDIARHKAGIIKENSETVAYNQENVIEIIKKTCEGKNSRLHIVDKKDIKNYNRDKEYQSFDYKEYKDIQINLKGKIQTINAAEVLEAVNILKEKGFNITDENIKDGLKNVVHRARFEVLSKAPLIVFDGGHNESAIQNLRENIKEYYGEYKNRVYIVSILKTKDYKTIVENLCVDKDAIYIFTSGINENYVPKEELYNVAEKVCTKENIFKLEFSEAIKTVKEKYKDNLILIVGSFYTYKKSVEILGVKR